MKETGYSKHYEDIVLIHVVLTGQKPDDLSNLEPQLLDDFDTLTNAYDQKLEKIIKLIEKTLLIHNMYYFNYYRRHKYPCKRADFNILKTIDT